MKKFVTALVFTLVTSAAFAQHWPGNGHGRGHGGGWRGPQGPYYPRPMPRPMPYPRPSANCRVAMVDRYNRPVRSYWGTRDYYSGMCRDALRQCNYDQRMMGNWNLRCVQY